MKVLSSTVVAVAAIASSDAFSTKGLTYRSQRTTSLNLQIEDSIKSRMGAAVAGLAIASQVALVASPALAAPTPVVTSQGKNVVMFAGLKHCLLIAKHVGLRALSRDVRIESVRGSYRKCNLCKQPATGWQ